MSSWYGNFTKQGFLTAQSFTIFCFCFLPSLHHFFILAFPFFFISLFCSLVYFRRHSSLLAAFPLSCLSFLVFTNSEPKEIVPAFHLTADILPRTLAFFVYFPAETMRLQSVE